MKLPEEEKLDQQEKLKCGMSEILRGLYVGGFLDAQDESQLKENDITHVVSVYHNPRPPQDRRRTYLCICAHDNANENLATYFSTVNDFVHDARRKGGGVLIHCMAGVSRSVTLATAYVMTVTDLGWRDALAVVRGARNQAYPNGGFRGLLSIFQHTDLKTERQRLRAKFQLDGDPMDDKAMCDDRIQAYRIWVECGDPGNSGSGPRRRDHYGPMY